MWENDSEKSTVTTHETKRRRRYYFSQIALHVTAVSRGDRNLSQD